MFVGHFAAGFVAKRIAPKVSLGTLVLASMLSDLLWTIFMIAGIEHVNIKPGIGAANYLDAYDIGYSHGLLMTTIWAALLAAAYSFRRRYPRGAWVLFAAVLSHWLLDWVSHTPDMPIAPGVDSHFGLGLWSSVPATLIVEGGFWLLAIIIYVRANHAEKRAGVYVFWGVIILLTLAWYNNIAGPPPSNPAAMGITSLIFFSLVVAWAYWINRLRPLKEPAVKQSGVAA